MPTSSLPIINKLGLHARASAKLTQLASQFPCDITLERKGRKINAKSIMGVMMLAAGMGTEVILETTGEQEQEAFAAIQALIADRFGEGE
jgi:phosphocarrier protein